MEKTTSPHGENLRNAIRWLSEQQQGHVDQPNSRALIETASLRFDLTPVDDDFLFRHFVIEKEH